MRNIQASYLGRNSFPRQLSDFEIREFFILRAADRRAIEGVIRGRLRLPVALQLAFLQMTGTTLDAFDYVPREVLDILGRQFGRPAPMLATLRALYRRRMTLFKHQSWALGHLGMHRYGPGDAGKVAATLTAECRASVDRDRLAVRVREMLYSRRCCIPSRRVIDDAVRRALRTVETEDAQLLHKAVTRTVTSAWYQRLMEQRPDGMSWLEWIRRPPARRSPKTLRRAVGKLLSLRDFDGLAEGRIVIPPERLRAYGRRLRGRKPAHVKSIVEPRRTPEIAGFLHTAIAHEADRVLRMLEMRIAQIWRWAYGVTSDQDPSRPQAGDEILWVLRQRVVNPDLSDREFRDFAKALLSAPCANVT